MDPTAAFRQYPPTGGNAPKKEQETDEPRRHWRAVRVHRFSPSVDPRIEPMYQSAVEGLRSDGITFGVPIMLKMAKVDLLQPAKALDLAAHSMNQALLQLQTFRDCDCDEYGHCDQHKGQME